MSIPYGMSNDGGKLDLRLSVTPVDDERGIQNVILTDGTTPVAVTEDGKLQVEVGATLTASGVTISDGTTAAQKLAISESGAASVQLTGSKLEEQKTNVDAVANVITFAANVGAIEIYHESPSWQAFVVNGLTISVPQGGYRTPIGGTPAATVTIPAGLSCIVGRLV